MELSNQDIKVLRELACQYADIAALPEQSARRALWLKLNGLHMERPLVLIDQIPWHEMDVDGALTNQVHEPYFRDVETALRRTIYTWRHMRADMVVNPYICLPRPILNTGWGIQADVDKLAVDASNDVVSQHMNNQIRSDEDIDRIQMPTISLDRAREVEIGEAAASVFGGIIGQRLTGQCMHLGIWDTISFWMGVTDCYIELMDRPEMMHRLMEKLTRGLLHMIDQMNAQGLFDIHSHICHCSHTFSAGLPRPDCDPDRPSSRDAWAYGMAQLFTSVSPAVTDEFEVQYMRRVFERFGAIYYGCCDRLDDRMDVIDKLPNIRKLSCSPWSDREHFAAVMPRRCVMSNKPNPALLATDSMDESLVRADLRRTVDAARAHGANLEIILKDISTVRYDPQRLWRWSEIALEEVSR